MKGCRDSMGRGDYDKAIRFGEEVLRSSGGDPTGPSMRKTEPNCSSVLEPLRGDPKGRSHPLFPMSMLVEDRRPKRRSRPFEPEDRLRVVAQHVAAERQVGAGVDVRVHLRRDYDGLVELPRNSEELDDLLR